MIDDVWREIEEWLEGQRKPVKLTPLLLRPKPKPATPPPPIVEEPTTLPYIMAAALFLMIGHLWLVVWAVR